MFIYSIYIIYMFIYGIYKVAVLRLLRLLKGSESWCLDVASKRVRRVMMRLKGGTAPLRIESG